MKKIKLIELFGGIGAQRLALENVFGKENIEIVRYIENDPKVVSLYNKMYDDNQITQDIRYFKKYYEEVDILFSSSPCQSFSQAGKNEGGIKDSGTQSSLLWETTNIIENKLSFKPKFVIWENVKGVLNKKHRPVFETYLEKMTQLGYVSTFKVLNSLDFGIPQTRNRVFVISTYVDSNFQKDIEDLFLKIKPSLIKRKLSDFLEKNVNERYYLDQKSMIKAIDNGKIKIISEHSQTITTKQMRWQNAGVLLIEVKEDIHRYWRDNNEDSYVGNIITKILYPILKTNNDNSEVFLTKPIFLIKGKYYQLRVLTPRETWRLMGFNDQLFDKVKDSKEIVLYKASGNSIVVPVLESIFREIAMLRKEN